MNALRFSYSNSTLTTPGFWVDVVTYTLENRIVTVCDGEGDDYRFGLKVLTLESVFNTQEKVDEPKRSVALEDPYQYKRTEKIAGKGNHNTALFWVFDADRSVSKYDTRLGRRWNVDPKPQISISDYAVNANNPIFFNDPLGDTIKVSGSKRFVNQTNKALSRMQKTEEGNRMYDKLHSSENVYTIRKYDRNITKVSEESGLPKDWEVGDIGFTGAKYNSGGFFMGKGGWLSLGHKLSHTEDVEDGASNNETWQTPDKTFTYPTVNFNSSTNTYSSGGQSEPIAVSPLLIDEVRAMDRENKMRAQSGIGLRTHYNTVIVNSVTVPDGRAIQIKINTQQVVKDGIGTHPNYNTNYNLLKNKK